MLRYFANVSLALASIVGSVVAASAPAFAAQSRHAAMAIDANTGQVLHNEDGDAKRHPASLTKMMTLYLTFETIASGRMSMQTKIPISAAAANAQPSKLDLDVGDEIAVGDAVRVLITKSANDIAIALAEKIGGSEANFVRLMNTRARDLGMTSTHFENASGLPDPDQVTTARDMITLALHLQDDFPDDYQLFATRQFTYGGRAMRNHNTLMNTFAGIDGIKTGYTRMSGFNLVSSVRRGGRHVVAAVFGGASAATRNGEMRIVLTKALTRAATKKTRKPFAFPTPALIAKLKAAPALADRKVAFAATKPKAVAEAAATPVVKPFAAPRSSDPTAARNAKPAPSAEPETAPPLTIADLAAPPPPPVEVFKVRRVVVMPRQVQPPVDPNATTDMDASTAAVDAAAIAPFVNSGLNSGGNAGLNSGVNSEPSAPIAAETLAATVVGEPLSDRARSAPVISQTAGQATDPSAGGENETIIGKLIEAAALSHSQPPDGRLQPASLIATAPSSKPLEQVAMLGAGTVETAVATPVEPIAAAAPVQAVPKPRLAVRPIALVSSTAEAPLRGLRPSSLQAQAQSKSSLIAQPVRLAAAPAGPVSGQRARVEVQIGAYMSMALAKEALQNVKLRAGSVLAGSNAIAVPVDKAGRTIYRARFSGFDGPRATSACTELRRQAIDCFVLAAQ